MRRSVIATAASAALLAGLGACSGGSESDVPSAAVAVVPVIAATPGAAADPYAWTDVLYEDYLEAADQLGIRPDLRRPLAGFSSGLNELCHQTPEQLAEMRKAQQANLNEADTFSAAQYMSDEVALRIGMACPQRMSDWTSTNSSSEDTATGGSEADGSEASVTDEDLARATAEEESASVAPDGDPAGYGAGHPSPDSGDSTPSAAPTGTATPAP